MMDKEEQLECLRCGSCCSYLLIRSAAKYEGEDTIRWLAYHGIELLNLTPELAGTVLKIPLKCMKLKPDGSCAVQDNKPDACKKFEVGMDLTCPQRPKRRKR